MVAAALGWLFDGFEVGLFPLVARPALGELLGPGSADRVSAYYAAISALFLVGAATGGVLFGWLGDRAGRVRALTASVLVYAGCTGLSAFAQTAWQLGALRFAGALGMGGEWALGVALVVELYPDSSRARLAAIIGAAGNLGYALVGTLALVLNRHAEGIPPALAALGLPAGRVESLAANRNWRLLLLAGSLPAALTLFVRLAVPESPRWLADRGAARKHRARDLLPVLAGAVVAVGLVAVWMLPAEDWLWRLLTAPGLVAVLWCYRAPAARWLVFAGLGGVETARLRRNLLVAASLSAVPLLATWAGFMWVYLWLGELPGGKHPDAVPAVQVASSLGAAAGSALGALAAARYGRRRVYAILCVLSAAALFAFYRLPLEFGPLFVLASAGVGLVTASFYGVLPLYLPELFPTALRATATGFAFNVGRVVAAIGTLAMPSLLAAFGGRYDLACSLIAWVYAAGLVVAWRAPPGRGED